MDWSAGLGQLRPHRPNQAKSFQKLTRIPTRVICGPHHDRRIWSVISPIFPYDFRRSLGVPENGRAEQSATNVEVTAEYGRMGDASKRRYLKWEQSQPNWTSANVLARQLRCRTACSKLCEWKARAVLDESCACQEYFSADSEYPKSASGARRRTDVETAVTNHHRLSVIRCRAGLAIHERAQSQTAYCRGYFSVTPARAIASSRK